MACRSLRALRSSKNRSGLWILGVFGGRGFRAVSRVEACLGSCTRKFSFRSRKGLASFALRCWERQDRAFVRGSPTREGVVPSQSPNGETLSVFSYEHFVLFSRQRARRLLTIQKPYLTRDHTKCYPMFGWAVLVAQGSDHLFCEKLSRVVLQRMHDKLILESSR